MNDKPPTKHPPGGAKDALQKSDEEALQLATGDAPCPQGAEGEQPGAASDSLKLDLDLGSTSEQPGLKRPKIPGASAHPSELSRPQQRLEEFNLSKVDLQLQEFGQDRVFSETMRRRLGRSESGRWPLVLSALSGIFGVLAICWTVWDGSQGFSQTKAWLRSSGLYQVGVEFLGISGQQQDDSPGAASGIRAEDFDTFPVPATELVFDWETSSCFDVSRLGSDGAQSRQGLELAVARSECLELAGKRWEALQALRPAMLSWKKASDAQLDAPRSMLGETFLHWVRLMVELGQNDERLNQLFPPTRCAQWQLRATCIGKLAQLLDRGFDQAAEAGFRALIPKMARLPNAQRAMLAYQYAQWLFRSGRHEAAFKAFDQASFLAPKRRPSLRLRVMEHWTFAAAAFAKSSEVRRVTRLAKTRLKLEDPTHGWKLAMHEAIHQKGVGSPVAKERLKDFFQNDQKVFDSRADPLFVASLGYGALVHGQSLAMQRLVKATQVKAQQLRASPSSTAGLSVWAMRSELARDRMNLVLSLSRRHQREAGITAVGKHFEGIALMRQSRDAGFAKQAMNAFQAAYNIRPRWESLYGLKLAYLRSQGTLQPRASQQSKRIWARLRAGAKSAEQKQWLSLLQAEALLMRKSYRQAEAILRNVLQQDQASLQARVLWIRLARAQGSNARAEAVNRELDILRSKVQYLHTKEGRSQPLGPLSVLEL